MFYTKENLSLEPRPCRSHYIIQRINSPEPGCSGFASSNYCWYSRYCWVFGFGEQVIKQRKMKFLKFFSNFVLWEFYTCVQHDDIRPLVPHFQLFSYPVPLLDIAFITWWAIFKSATLLKVCMGLGQPFSFCYSPEFVSRSHFEMNVNSVYAFDLNVVCF